MDGLTFPVLIIVIKETISRSELRIGCAARFMQHTHVSSVAADLSGDVLPLLVPTPSSEEVASSRYLRQ